MLNIDLNSCIDKHIAPWTHSAYLTVIHYLLIGHNVCTRALYSTLPRSESNIKKQKWLFHNQTSHFTLTTVIGNYSLISINHLILISFLEFKSLNRRAKHSSLGPKCWIEEPNIHLLALSVELQQSLYLLLVAVVLGF